MESDVGQLCYKKNSVALCFKKGGSQLVYKIASGGETTVTFAWASDLKDLDILAYWDGAPDLTAGYGHGSGGTSGPYSISYSGDSTSADSSEWVRVAMSPWGSGGARTLRVHFNCYGFGDDYPGSACMVIASQPDGPTIIKYDQPCATRKGQPADTSDPCCVVTFDERGNLVSVS